MTMNTRRQRHVRTQWQTRFKKTYLKKRPEKIKHEKTYSRQVFNVLNPIVSNPQYLDICQKPFPGMVRSLGLPWFTTFQREMKPVRETVSRLRSSRRETPEMLSSLSALVRYLAPCEHLKLSLGWESVLNSRFYHIDIDFDGLTESDIILNLCLHKSCEPKGSDDS